MTAKRKIQALLAVVAALFMLGALFPSAPAAADGSYPNDPGLPVESASCYAGHFYVAHPNGGYVKYRCDSSVSMHGLCASGQFCVYKDNHFKAGVARFFGNDSNYNGNSFDLCQGWCGLNDRASSARNNGNFCQVTLRKHSNYGGTGLTFPLGTQAPILGNYAIGNDQASSHVWC